LDELVKSGFLKDYLVGSSTAATLRYLKRIRLMRCPSTEKSTPSLVDSQVGGGTASQRKRYARSVMSVAGQVAGDDPVDVDLTFTRANLHDVVPHDNDPVVISVVTAGRKVHRVLVDQRELRGCDVPIHIQ